MCGSLSGLCVKPSQVERSDSEKPTERLLFENSFNKLTHSNLSGSRRTNRASMFAVDLGSCDIRSGGCLTSCAHRPCAHKHPDSAHWCNLRDPAPGLQVIFTALGSYVHPPRTKVVTNQSPGNQMFWGSSL